MRKALLVIAKRPAAGQTKTRLCPPLLGVEAADLYECMLRDALETARRVAGVERLIAYAPYSEQAYFRRLAPDFDLVPQRGASLGERLDNVLTHCLNNGFGQAVIMDSDSPTLPHDHVAGAFTVLDGADVALGPCEDGGYYLIGLTQPQPRLLREVVMSTPHVLDDTLALARQENLRVALLPPWYDVDTVAELERLRVELVDAQDGVARHTRSFLARPPASAVVGGWAATRTCDARAVECGESVAASAATTDSSHSTPGVPQHGLTDCAVIIPALNEAATIARLVGELRALHVGAVIVVDNGSSDGTAAAARAAGATVVTEPRRGYGYACAAGVAAARLRQADALLFIDGDGSFAPAETPRLLAPLRDGTADLVLGSRALGSMQPGAMPPAQRFGNALVALLVRRLYHVALTDIGPLRAVKADLLSALDMQEMTFGWPVEMVVKAARRGARIVEVPVSYARRQGGRSKVSGTVRGTLLAGYRMLAVVLRSVR